MAGRRLLDVVVLFNASRGVWRKHVALRSNQLEIFDRSSTLARAVRSQTDRVTETVKAASILASKLNEETPWTLENGSRRHGNESTPSQRSTTGPINPVADGRIDQDHFNDKSVDNTAIGEPPKDAMKVVQHASDQYPLPDGIISPESLGSSKHNTHIDGRSGHARADSSQSPLDLGEGQPEDKPPHAFGKSALPEDMKSANDGTETQIPSMSAGPPQGPASEALLSGHDEDTFTQPSLNTSKASSSLPTVQVPQHASDLQTGSSSPYPGPLNSDSYYSVEEPETMPAMQAVSAQDQVPDDINTDVSHSGRISQLLGGRSRDQGRSELELRGATDRPIEDTALSADKDQETFNVRSSEDDISTTRVNSYGSQPTIMSHEASALGPKHREKADKTNNEVSYKDVHREAHLSRLVTQSGDQGSQSPKPYELRESKVPSTRLGRMWNYGGLAVGMFGGAIGESLRRVSGGGGGGSYILSEGNMDRLVAKLSRMRGAALKLGQLISFQDSKMLPGPIREVLQRVQDRADYMPTTQRDKVLTTNLGPEWRDLFSSFEEKPLAAASIGQVHSAVLRSNGARVAVKVQYPGVADSIDSDLSNLGILLTASRLLPKGLFLDKTIANARTELAWECDYIREAECGARFESLLSEEDIFVVPKVYGEASGKQVLTMEFMDGIGVTRVQSFTQEQRDWIGTHILRLCLREITEFRFMQTDPNWTNFLYNAQTNKLELLDFGASREYPEQFIEKYTKLLVAASRSNKHTVQELSVELGYLTGQESSAMLNAHTESVLTLAEPFLDSSPEIYDFRDQTITDRVKEQIPLMIRERLAPPPEETYSLHRKLSGAFLLCARLGSRVKCRELFQTSMAKAGVL